MRAKYVQVRDLQNGDEIILDGYIFRVSNVGPIEPDKHWKQEAVLPCHLEKLCWDNHIEHSEDKLLAIYVDKTEKLVCRTYEAPKFPSPFTIS